MTAAACSRSAASLLISDWVAANTDCPRSADVCAEFAADTAADQPGNQKAGRQTCNQEYPYQPAGRRGQVSQFGALGRGLFAQGGNQHTCLTGEIRHEWTDLGAHQVDVELGLVTAVYIEHLSQGIQIGLACHRQPYQGVHLLESQQV